MIKKIIAGFLILGIILLAGWKLFFNRDDGAKKILETMKDVKAYHMEANMDIKEPTYERHYLVTSDYYSHAGIENFRISLLDKDINQEQIMLRNKDGVFVMTPLLNQVYEFKGDWPLNSPKPYLYQSLVKSFENKSDVKKVEGGYLSSTKADYPNSPEFVKQEVKFSSDSKPIYVNIYGQDGTILTKIVFTVVDLAPTFSETFFDVKENMEMSRKNIPSKPTTTIDDLPLLPVTTGVTSVLKENTKATVGGESIYILTFEGTENFTIVQKIIKESDEMSVSKVSGQFVSMEAGITYVNGSHLTYIRDNVSYEIYGDGLSLTKLVSIAESLVPVEEK